jgi:hypothetical protein
MNDDANDDHILPQYLSDEAAAALVELLYDLAAALENRYLGQVIRHHQHRETRQQDLWD